METENNTPAAPWPHLRWLLPAVAAVGSVAAGNALGLSVGFLVFAGAVLVGSILLFSSSLQGLTGSAPLTLDEAVSLGAPSSEEEQKRAVLRALKDLEYEREVGKINDEDYAVLAARYREEAKRLLRLVDEGLRAERERAERLLQERMQERPATDGAEPVPSEADAASETPEPAGQDIDSQADEPLAKSPRPEATAAAASSEAKQEAGS